MTILEMIQGGESKRVEFKEKLSQSEGIVKTAIAFANNGGGFIIIGVEDKTKKIKGITDTERDEYPDRITNILFDTIEPKISFEVECYTIQNKSLIVIEVFPGPQVPYYHKSQGKSQGIYVRVGATTRRADEESIAQLNRQRLNISFDEEIMPSYDIKNLDLENLKFLLKEELQKNITTETLINLKILKKVNKKIQPTVASILLCGKWPLHENCSIDCAHFKENNLNEFIDKKQYTGSIIHQLNEALNFIKMHLPLRAKITKLKREESYEIPLMVIREAIVNAIIHRDYTASGSNIKIAIFPNRIEIISPGGLPKGVSLEEISMGRSETRNRVIARVFKELKYIEQWGTGIYKIIHTCKEQNLKPPLFQEIGQFFKVTIFRETIQKTELSNHESKIILFLDKHDMIKSSQAVELLHLSPSRVRGIFESLVEKQKIIAHGKGKYRYYTKN